MPKDIKGGFDISVSSFSLLHLSSKEERLNTLNQLWKLTDQYLVLVENGSLSGFKVINEARDFLLNVCIIRIFFSFFFFLHPINVNLWLGKN